MTDHNDLTVHVAVSDWVASEWKDSAVRLRVLLAEGLLFVEHEPTCDAFLRPRLGCNCGLAVWRGMVERMLANTPNLALSETDPEGEGQ